MLRTNDPAGFGLGTFSAGDSGAFAGLVQGDEVIDLSTQTDRLGLIGPISTLVLLESWDELLPILRELAADPGVPRRPLEGLEVHAPVQPRQILQSGANYRTHVIDLHLAHAEPAEGRDEEEARAEAEAIMDRRAAEGSPYLFIGLPSAVTGPYDDVRLPATSDQHDWELELAAVIGREVYRVTPEQALSHVAGYTIANDLTTRDAVFRRDMPAIGTDWLQSKNSPGFTPLGPYLVPAAFVGDPMNLQVTLTLNGDVMQDASTEEMIFDVAALVAAASQTVRLLPGDLLLTGSPAGNGIALGRLLRDGDVMEGRITGLGMQRTRVVAEEVAQ
ncbi:fumarylacetoacetate hydrolase family protein [Egicoccus sp. AB-alg2]|uniref:fumarylacetoacetate hydrolase family protein n=1 Tax=Egicoccus sp. AB-alg2 TaxID=3242693 RepID=UPI00359DBB62